MVQLCRYKCSVRSAHNIKLTVILFVCPLVPYLALLCSFRHACLPACACWCLSSVERGDVPMFCPGGGTFVHTLCTFSCATHFPCLDPVQYHCGRRRWGWGCFPPGCTCSATVAQLWRSAVRFSKCGSWRHCGMKVAKQPLCMQWSAVTKQPLLWSDSTSAVTKQPLDMQCVMRFVVK